MLPTLSHCLIKTVSFNISLRFFFLTGFNSCVLGLYSAAIPGISVSTICLSPTQALSLKVQWSLAEVGEILFHLICAVPREVMCFWGYQNLIRATKSSGLLVVVMQSISQNARIIPNSS